MRHAVPLKMFGAHSSKSRCCANPILLEGFVVRAHGLRGGGFPRPFPTRVSAAPFRHQIATGHTTGFRAFAETSRAEVVRAALLVPFALAAHAAARCAVV